MQVLFYLQSTFKRFWAIYVDFFNKLSNLFSVAPKNSPQEESDEMKYRIHDPDIFTEDEKNEKKSVNDFANKLQNQDKVKSVLNCSIRGNDPFGYLLNYIKNNPIAAYIQIGSEQKTLFSIVCDMIGKRTRMRNELIVSIEQIQQTTDSDSGFIDLESSKDTKNQIINYMVQVYTNTSSSPVLALSGPLGSGKNETLKYVANRLGYSIVKFAVSDPEDRYISYKAGRMAGFFDKMLISKNKIFVFDDMSQIFENHSGHNDTKVADNQRSEMAAAFAEGISRLQNKSVPIIGITRCIETLHHNVSSNLRVIPFRLLNLNERKQLIQSKLECFSEISDKDNIIDNVAKYTDGWSIGGLSKYLNLISESLRGLNNNQTEIYKCFIKHFIYITDSMKLMFPSTYKPVFPRLILKEEPIEYGDMADADQEIQTQFAVMLDTIKYPEIYRMHIPAKPQILLLCGPGGTGKTAFAKTLASNANITFFYINTSDLSGHGSSQVGSLKKVFNYAKTVDCMIFFDEIDAIYSPSYPEAIRNMIKTEIDGFEKENEKNFIFIAATNHPERMDSAAKTRFQRLEFKLPTAEKRSQLFLNIITGYLENESSTVDNKTISLSVAYGSFNDINHAAQQLAEITDGLSYREITNIMTNRLRVAIMQRNQSQNAIPNQICFNVEEHVYKYINQGYAKANPAKPAFKRDLLFSKQPNFVPIRGSGSVLELELDPDPVPAHYRWVGL